jgi:hypothetical protein
MATSWGLADTLAAVLNATWRKVSTVFRSQTWSKRFARHVEGFIASIAPEQRRFAERICRTWARSGCNSVPALTAIAAAFILRPLAAQLA